MSRSGYTDDYSDNWAHICWRGAVASAIRGKRGQAMLKETLAALEALPEKTLAADSLVNADGQYCTLGALGRARNIDMAKIDPDNIDSVKEVFGVTHALAAEIMYLNDDSTPEYYWGEVELCGPLRWNDRRFVSIKRINKNAGHDRYEFMRNWLEKNITKSDEVSV